MTYTIILTDPKDRFDHRYTITVPTDNHVKAISAALRWARKTRDHFGWTDAQIKLETWTREEIASV